MSTTSIRISKDLLAELKALADSQFRTVPKTIEWLLHEYKTRTESAQEYCEREPMRSEILQAMEDMKDKQNFQAYNSVKELFDDIH